MVGSEIVSKVVGYNLSTFNSNVDSPNLPQRIALLGEANHANQADLDTTPFQITSAQQAGSRYGYGSPLHLVSRILFPASGGGVGSIPVIVYPQAAAVGAAAKVIEIAPSGVATGNGTHTLVIAGRKGLEAAFYNINIEEGDTVADITQKIEDAVNAVLGAPVTAASTEYVVDLTTKWKGLTANQLTVTIDDNGDALGISYSITDSQAGSGTPSISAALTAFGNNWNTIVINTYGTQTNICDALEQFNGKPDATNPTGRFADTVMKPFIALTGSTAEDPGSFTDTRKNEVTIAICPAPLSAGFHFEAAANVAVLFARKEQDTPELDISGDYYLDMPTPTSIGAMATLTNRDTIVKKGCSTVDLVAGAYKVQDFVTTYHKEGEVPPQFRYCRDLMLDLNIAYRYLLMVEAEVTGKVIANDNDVVINPNVIKPKQFRQLIISLFDQAVKDALVVDLAFTVANLQVSISTVNPKRFDVAFQYKRSGNAHVVSTTAKAGFNFGVAA